MTEPLLNTPESTPILSKSNSQSVGCIFILCGWLLLWPIMYLVTLAIFSRVDGMFITLPFLCLLVIGIVGAFFLGLQFGPRLIPGFYAWIESHPFLLGIIPGTAIGVFAMFVGIWVPAIYSDAQVNAQYPGAGAGDTLGAMFLGTPLALFLGPIIGLIGSLIAGAIGNRLFRKSRSWFLIYGISGGGIAGLMAGVLPYALLWLLHFIGIQGF